MNGHLGTLELPAPAYSAVKHQGRALYTYARRGIEVPAKPRVSTVREWKALSFAAPDLEHRLLCSSGTYVRSLAESVGRRLGCGGTVATLRRESIASFTLDGALTLDSFKALKTDDIKRLLDESLPVLQAAAKHPA